MDKDLVSKVVKGLLENTKSEDYRIVADLLKSGDVKIRIFPRLIDID